MVWMPRAVYAPRWMTLEQRFASAEQIRRLASPVAEEVIDALLRAHPNWLVRYGEWARAIGLEETRSHVNFLAAALERGSRAAFADYARWTARVLEARSIGRDRFGESLAQMQIALAARLSQDVVDALDQYVATAFDALSEPAAVPARESVQTAARDDLELTRSLYVQAALAGERTVALRVLTEALSAGTPLLDLYVEVLQQGQYEIGHLWETNRITVAHEHAATAVTQFVATHLYARLERVGPSRGTLVMAGVEGELHSIGALMVGDVLESRGWTVHHLGTNLPQASILQTMRERAADCLGLSVTMLVNLDAVRRVLEAVRREWGKGKRVVLGGGALRHRPAVASELGADGYAVDLRHALALLCPETR